MSKYEPLWKYLKNSNKNNYKLSYEEIKEILGFDINHSFLTYKKEAREYGYEVKKISMKEKTIIFNKI
jgi:transposase